MSVVFHERFAARIGRSLHGIGKTPHMNALRKILLPLLIIPLGMFLYAFLYPDWQWETTGFEYLFFIIGIPILVANFAAWFYPEIIQFYFPVKEAGEQKGEKVATFGMVISALIAFTCVGIGAASAVASLSSRPTLDSSRVQSITATAFARSVRVLASATDSDERASVSTPRPSPEVSAASEQTPQIPVSGGVPTSSPIPSTGSSALAGSVTPTEVASTSTGPTNTAAPLGSCTPAVPEYLETIGQEVQDADPENVVVAGWMRQSAAAEDLWFIAAKIQSDTGTTFLGVWGVFADPEGIYDIYAINDVAMDLSYTAWGEDSEPVLTMQSDGAQAVYDCAAQAP